MSTDSGSPGAGGAPTGTTSGPARPDLDDGPDAADAAGFGGITWADEATDEPPETHAASGPEALEVDEAEAVDEPETVEVVEEDISFGQGATYPPPDDGAGNTEHEVPSDSAPGNPISGEISVEDLVRDLERVTVERDEYLDASRRLQAEFENYRKAVAKRETESRERANESLVVEILPVLDACDGALASGATDVEPVRSALMGALARQGLDRIDDQDGPFDPVRHDAVMHEPDEDGEGPVVAEVMRAGYSWKGRVVRPAMVRVRG